MALPQQHPYPLSGEGSQPQAGASMRHGVFRALQQHYSGSDIRRVSPAAHQRRHIIHAFGIGNRIDNPQGAPSQHHRQNPLYNTDIVFCLNDQFTHQDLPEALERLGLKAIHADQEAMRFSRDVTPESPLSQLPTKLQDRLIEVLSNDTDVFSEDIISELTEMLLTFPTQETISSLNQLELIQKLLLFFPDSPAYFYDDISNVLSQLDPFHSFTQESLTMLAGDPSKLSEIIHYFATHTADLAELHSFHMDDMTEGQPPHHTMCSTLHSLRLKLMANEEDESAILATRSFFATHFSSESTYYQIGTAVENHELDGPELAQLLDMAITVVTHGAPHPFILKAIEFIVGKAQYNPLTVTVAAIAIDEESSSNKRELGVAICGSPDSFATSMLLLLGTNIGTAVSNQLGYLDFFSGLCRMTSTPPSFEVQELALAHCPKDTFVSRQRNMATTLQTLVAADNAPFSSEFRLFLSRLRDFVSNEQLDLSTPYLFHLFDEINRAVNHFVSEDFTPETAIYFLFSIDAFFDNYTTAMPEEMSEYYLKGLTAEVTSRADAIVHTLDTEDALPPYLALCVRTLDCLKATAYPAPVNSDLLVVADILLDCHVTHTAPTLDDLLTLLKFSAYAEEELGDAFDQQVMQLVSQCINIPQAALLFERLGQSALPKSAKLALCQILSSEDSTTHLVISLMDFSATYNLLDPAEWDCAECIQSTLSTAFRSFDVLFSKLPPLNGAQQVAIAQYYARHGSEQIDHNQFLFATLGIILCELDGFLPISEAIRAYFDTPEAPLRQPGFDLVRTVISKLMPVISVEDNSLTQETFNLCIASISTTILSALPESMNTHINVIGLKGYVVEIFEQQRLLAPSLRKVDSILVENLLPNDFFLDVAETFSPCDLIDLCDKDIFNLDNTVSFPKVLNAIAESRSFDSAHCHTMKAKMTARLMYSHGIFLRDINFSNAFDFVQRGCSRQPQLLDKLLVMLLRTPSPEQLDPLLCLMVSANNSTPGQSVACKAITEQVAPDAQRAKQELGQKLAEHKSELDRVTLGEDPHFVQGWNIGRLVKQPEYSTALSLNLVSFANTLSPSVKEQLTTVLAEELGAEQASMIPELVGMIGYYFFIGNSIAASIIENPISITSLSYDLPALAFDIMAPVTVEISPTRFLQSTAEMLSIEPQDLVAEILSTHALKALTSDLCSSFLQNSPSFAKTVSRRCASLGLDETFGPFLMSIISSEERPSDLSQQAMRVIFDIINFTRTDDIVHTGRQWSVLVRSIHSLKDIWVAEHTSSYPEDLLKAEAQAVAFREDCVMSDDILQTIFVQLKLSEHVSISDFQSILKFVMKDNPLFYVDALGLAYKCAKAGHIREAYTHMQEVLSEMVSSLDTPYSLGSEEEAITARLKGAIKFYSKPLFIVEKHVEAVVALFPGSELLQHHLLPIALEDEQVAQACESLATITTTSTADNPAAKRRQALALLYYKLSLAKALDRSDHNSSETRDFLESLMDETVVHCLRRPIEEEDRHNPLLGLFRLSIDYMSSFSDFCMASQLFDIDQEPSHRNIVTYVWSRIAQAQKFSGQRPVPLNPGIDRLVTDAVSSMIEQMLRFSAQSGILSKPNIVRALVRQLMAQEPQIVCNMFKAITSADRISQVQLRSIEDSRILDMLTHFIQSSAFSALPPSDRLWLLVTFNLLSEEIVLQPIIASLTSELESCEDDATVAFIEKHSPVLNMILRSPHVHRDGQVVALFGTLFSKIFPPSLISPSGDDFQARYTFSMALLPLLLAITNLGEGHPIHIQFHEQALEMIPGLQNIAISLIQDVLSDNSVYHEDTPYFIHKALYLAYSFPNTEGMEELILALEYHFVACIQYFTSTSRIDIYNELSPTHPLRAVFELMISRPGAQRNPACKALMESYGSPQITPANSQDNLAEEDHYEMPEAVSDLSSAQHTTVTRVVSLLNTHFAVNAPEEVLEFWTVIPNSRHQELYALCAQVEALQPSSHPDCLVAISKLALFLAEFSNFDFGVELQQLLPGFSSTDAQAALEGLYSANTSSVGKMMMPHPERVIQLLTTHPESDVANEALAILDAFNTPNLDTKAKDYLILKLLLLMHNHPTTLSKIHLKYYFKVILDRAPLALKAKLTAFQKSTTSLGDLMANLSFDDFSVRNVSDA